MANPEHSEWLHEGVEARNQRWKEFHLWREIVLNPRRAHIRTEQRSASRWRVRVLEKRAKLAGADLAGADLQAEDLSKAYLPRANLNGANLRDAWMPAADLTDANLGGAHLVRAADLTGCRVYGISVWDLELDDETKRKDLVITWGEPEVSADKLEVAQFVYLLLANPKVRDIIDTVTSKVVLILGRFTDERLAVLEGIRDALRHEGYVPVLFDFAGPASQDVLETVQTVARLSRFVVADVTDARAVDQELQAIVPQIRVAVRPLMLAGAEEPGKTFQALWGQFPDRMMKIHRYEGRDELLASFSSAIVRPAEGLAKQLKARDLDDIFA